MIWHQDRTDILAWLDNSWNCNWTTRRYSTHGLDSRHLTDWSTRELVNSRTRQVADYTTRRCRRQFCVQRFM